MWIGIILLKQIPSRMLAHGLFPLYTGGYGVHDLQKEFQILIHWTTGHCLTSPQSILNELRPREVSRIFGIRVLSFALLGFKMHF